jgi:hypothetical protein
MDLVTEDLKLTDAGKIARLWVGWENIQI